MTGPWTIGGRYGNLWTELIRGDYEDVVLVKTHEDGRTRYPQEPDHQPIDGWTEKLARYADALNAADARPLPPDSERPQPHREDSRP